MEVNFLPLLQTPINVTFPESLIRLFRNSSALISFSTLRHTFFIMKMKFVHYKLRKKYQIQKYSTIIGVIELHQSKIRLIHITCKKNRANAKMALQLFCQKTAKIQQNQALVVNLQTLFNIFCLITFILLIHKLYMLQFHFKILSIFLRYCLQNHSRKKRLDCSKHNKPTNN